MDLHWYLRSLEEVVIRVLSSTFSLKASRHEGLTGVWIGMPFSFVLLSYHTSIVSIYVNDLPMLRTKPSQSNTTSICCFWLFFNALLHLNQLSVLSWTENVNRKPKDCCYWHSSFSMDNLSWPCAECYHRFDPFSVHCPLWLTRQRSL